MLDIKNYNLFQTIKLTKSYKIITSKDNNDKDIKSIEKSIYNISKNYLNIKDKVDTHKTNNPNILNEIIKDRYNIQSLQRFRYFVLNVSNKTNPNTGEVYFNNFDKHNTFRYAHNITTSDMKDFKLYETKQGEFLDSIFNQWAKSKIARIKYIEYHNIKDKKDNLVKLFITITLPTQYHPFKYYNKYGTSRKNKNYIYNNLEDSIKDGFVILNKINRHFYNIVKKKLKRAKLDIDFDYMSVIEPHKTLIPHMHNLYYITKEQQDIFISAYKTTIKKFKIKRQKIEIISKASGSTYLYKYLVKMESNFKYYKKYFSKNRIFKISNLKHTNQAQINFIYKYLYKHKKKLLDYYKSKDIPLYVSLENFILKRVQFNYKKNTEIKLNIKELEILIKNAIAKYDEYKEKKPNTPISADQFISLMGNYKDYYHLNIKDYIALNSVMKYLTNIIFSDYKTISDLYQEQDFKKIESIYLKRDKYSQRIYQADENNFISNKINKQDLYEYFIDLYSDFKES